MLTLSPFKSASLPFSIRDTKNPMPNSRPPLIANPYDEFVVSVRRAETFGRDSRTTRIRGVAPLRDDATSLELDESLRLLLQSVSMLLLLCYAVRK